MLFVFFPPSQIFVWEEYISGVVFEAFSAFSRQSLVFTPLKSASKTHSKLAMWETTFPRLTHAGLGMDLTTRDAHSSACYLR